ncbi:MAG: hypothetical protein ACPL5F_07005 [Moorellaceae bacterium]
MLTQRRLQFLDKIKKLYQETEAPVHYAKVAETLRVSKWTAYDLLRELEREGFLQREYVVNSVERLPGRSMIMFVPTEKAYQIEGEGGSAHGRYGDWQEVKERLLRIFNGLPPGEAKSVVHELLEEMQEKEHPLISSAYTLTVLLIYLKAVGEKALNLIRTALQRVVRPETGLVLVTGTALGLAANEFTPLPFTAQVVRYIHSLQEQIEGFTNREKKLLAEFLQEALNQR